jgi:hypothetical protein
LVTNQREGRHGFVTNENSGARASAYASLNASGSENRLRTSAHWLKARIFQ